LRRGLDGFRSSRKPCSHLFVRNVRSPATNISGNDVGSGTD
jgi:hypothetical protein